MGVWIETPDLLKMADHCQVTPCVGVWIETEESASYHTESKSHPAWVCGLKLSMVLEIMLSEVTPCVGVWIETCISEDLL